MIVSGKIKDIDQTKGFIRSHLPGYLRNPKGYLGHLITMINALSPENTLKRGFAIVKVNNVITSDPGQLTIGKDMEIILSQKSITATVKSKKDYNGTEFIV